MSQSLRARVSRLEGTTSGAPSVSAVFFLGRDDDARAAWCSEVEAAGLRPFPVVVDAPPIGPLDAGSEIAPGVTVLSAPPIP
ncbi:hypothetical protein [Rubrivirga sp.]|uniref:hypothetical protein n=1 Tax=Rubrivirga sp. TaxID=1885344 RepID=UPI003C709A60